MARSATLYMVLSSDTIIRRVVIPGDGVKPGQGQGRGRGHEG